MGFFCARESIDTRAIGLKEIKPTGKSAASLSSSDQCLTSVGGVNMH